MFERTPECREIELSLDRGDTPSDMRHLQRCTSCQSYQRACSAIPAVLPLMLGRAKTYFTDGDVSDHHRAAVLLLQRAMVLVNALRAGNQTTDTMLRLNLKDFLYALYQVQSHNPGDTLDELSVVPLIVAMLNLEDFAAAETFANWKKQDWES